MKINFENTNIGICREVFHQTKRTQVSMESVVPDTNDDVGRIASVQTCILLKGKEMAGRGAFISGEVQAAILYITEEENQVSCVKLSGEFNLDFELGDSEEEPLTQIQLNVVNSEARVLNPRKLSLTVEVAGELSAYRREEIPAETFLPTETGQDLHLRTGSAECTLPMFVGEKSFVLNEQFNFPAGKPQPCQLLSQKVNYCIDDTQQVGTRLIVKGTVKLAVCYLSEEVCYPLQAAFSAPFSQIVEVGEECCSCVTAAVEPTSCYFDLIDSISGEKALEAELHAVMQIVGRDRREIAYIEDAYSNRMPLTCIRESRQLPIVSPMQRVRLFSDEPVMIADDCEDVLSVLPAVTVQSSAADKLRAGVSLDIIYQSTDGRLACVKRLLNLEGDTVGPEVRILGAELGEVNLRPNGGTLEGRIGAELCVQSYRTIEISAVGSAELAEEAAYDLSALPSIFLVRADGESLWDLAKTYHSSTEVITAMNEEAGDMLLIPREI